MGQRKRSADATRSRSRFTLRQAEASGVLHRLGRVADVEHLDAGGIRLADDARHRAVAQVVGDIADEDDPLKTRNTAKSRRMKALDWRVRHDSKPAASSVTSRRPRKTAVGCRRSSALPQ